MTVHLLGRGLLSTYLTLRDLNCSIKWFYLCRSKFLALQIKFFSSADQFFYLCRSNFLPLQIKFFYLCRSIFLPL